MVPHLVFALRPQVRNQPLPTLTCDQLCGQRTLSGLRLVSTNILACPPPAQAGSALRCLCRGQGRPAISQLADLDFCLRIFFKANSSLFSVPLVSHKGHLGRGHGPKHSLPILDMNTVPCACGVLAGMYYGEEHWDRLGPSLGPKHQGTLNSRGNWRAIARPLNSGGSRDPTEAV